MLAGAGIAQAQEVFGILRGFVTDATGAPAAGAQVSLSGTALAAVADEQGRYAMAHVPAGEYSVRAELAGSAVERLTVRVPAGATVLLDLRLGSGGATPAGPPVSVAGTGELTSRLVIPGDLLRDLPVDDARQALILSPGVVLRGSDIGAPSAGDLSLRGGALGEAAVYIDGAPARFETFGTQGISVSTEALAEAAVTTGVPSVVTEDARSGVIAYVTRAGGPQLAASFRARTDEPFGDGSSVGFNRFEGAVGGPALGVRHLTWFFSAALQGQRGQYVGRGAEALPTYVLGGLDTVVNVVQPDGNVTPVALPRFVQFSGPCPSGSDASNVARDAILHNYGFACQGLRRPMDWSSLIRGQAKLLYTYGAGSSLSLTGLASGVQQRAFPGQLIGDPLLYQGSHVWSRLAVMNWSQRLGAWRGGPLTLNVNLSRGTDRAIGGPLAPVSEVTTRDPALGIEFNTLQFTGLDVFPFPITDQIIQNIRSNAVCPDATAQFGGSCKVPFLNRTDLRTAQSGRINPYGMLRGGWPTQGLAGSLTLASEQRLNGRGYLEWQPGHVHHITLGADGERTDLSFYTADLLSEINLDAFIVHPRRYGAFVQDRLELGTFTLDLGARYDHFNAGGQFSKTPGRIFSNPAWAQAPNYQAAVDSVFTPSVTHQAVSPRLRVAYAPTPRTSVRVAVGEQVDPLPVGVLFAHANNDLSFTNTSELFGRDVGLAKTTLLEFGARQALTSAVALEASIYHKAHLFPDAARIQSFPDPAFPGKQVNLNALTRLDGGSGTGVDVRLDWQHGPFLAGFVSYSWLPEGSSPDPSTSDVSTHAVTALAGARVPHEWKEGTLFGTLAGDLRAFMTLRLTSGLHYTRLRNTGSGIVAPEESFLLGNSIESVNASRLPWTKSLDLQLAKVIQQGGRSWTIFVEARNLLDFTNAFGAYAETGTQTNDLYRTELLATEYQDLAAEAGTNNALLPGGTVDLRSCACWTTPTS